MRWNDISKGRILSVAGFSLLSAYILSFLFEGQVLYSLLDLRKAEASGYILATIIAHFAGLLSCGFIVKSPKAAKYTMIRSMGVCLISTLPFFFAPSLLWHVGLIAGGYVSGCTVAAWGYLLKTFTPKNERMKSCADVLICSNIIMIAINVVTMNLSPLTGLALSVFCLISGMGLIWALPDAALIGCGEENQSRPHGHIGTSLMLLCLFVFIITINSGLMYQVINPAFVHLTGLVSWYWAVPYIVVLVVMRNLPMKVNRSRILYVGMAMIMGAFIGFMLLKRNAFDYLVVDTLMLAACGIFDLFWWSILGEMLDYTDNPSKVLGIGLSANVSGVLFGGAVGMAITTIKLSGAEVTVIALTVICITLVLLPPLNRQLVMLLKNHTYLAVYDSMSLNQQAAIINNIKTLEPLTVREEEVLQHILEGESNRVIAKVLSISENTVKSHVANIFSKYDVGSRAELISTLLKNQSRS
jgi:DNA-binding CsgD family transcriptional regulator